MTSKIKWLSLILAFIVFLGLVSWGLFAIAKNLFNSSGSSSIKTAKVQGVDFDISTAQVAEFRVEGPIVANQKHRSYKITVSDSRVSIELYQSYGSKLLKSKTYPNTEAAFSNFMAALQQQNIQLIRAGSNQEMADRDKGVCPGGRRYILEIDQDLSRWATSCSSKEGNAGFKMRTVRQLFQRQVPDFREVVRGSGL